MFSNISRWVSKIHVFGNVPQQKAFQTISAFINSNEYFYYVQNPASKFQTDFQYAYPKKYFDDICRASIKMLKSQVSNKIFIASFSLHWLLRRYNI